MQVPLCHGEAVMSSVNLESSLNLSSYVFTLTYFPSR